VLDAEFSTALIVARLTFLARSPADVEVVPASGAHVLSLMPRNYVIMTKPGLDALVERLQYSIELTAM
jgi:hypothetical protein